MAVRWLMVSIGLLGCVSNLEAEKPQDAATDTSTSDSEETETEIDDDSEAPSILDADAWCYRIDVGGIVETWKFVARATDPQGEETLASYIPGGVTFMDNDRNEIDSISLICNEGECSTTVNATAINASCSEAEAYKVRFFVEDNEGNRSSFTTIDTRLGVDENG